MCINYTKLYNWNSDYPAPNITPWSNNSCTLDDWGSFPQEGCAAPRDATVVSGLEYLVFHDHGTLSGFLIPEVIMLCLWIVKSKNELEESIQNASKLQAVTKQLGDWWYWCLKWRHKSTTYMGTVKEYQSTSLAGLSFYVEWHARIVGSCIQHLTHFSPLQGVADEFVLCLLLDLCIPLNSCIKTARSSSTNKSWQPRIWDVDHLERLRKKALYAIVIVVGASLPPPLPSLSLPLLLTFDSHTGHHILSLWSLRTRLPFIIGTFFVYMRPSMAVLNSNICQLKPYLS